MSWYDPSEHRDRMLLPEIRQAPVATHHGDIADVTRTDAHSSSVLEH